MATIDFTNKTPVASIVRVGSGYPSGGPLVFSAATSSDPEGRRLAYSWDHAYDGTFEAQAALGSLVTANAPAIGGTKGGYYQQVALRVTDEHGAWGQSSVYIVNGFTTHSPVVRLNGPIVLNGPNDPYYTYILVGVSDPDDKPNTTETELSTIEIDINGDGIFDLGTVATRQSSKAANSVMVTYDSLSALCTPGVTYDVLVKVTDKSGLSGYASTKLHLNGGPVVGDDVVQAATLDEFFARGTDALKANDRDPEGDAFSLTIQVPDGPVRTPGFVGTVELTQVAVDRYGHYGQGKVTLTLTGTAAAGIVVDGLSLDRRAEGADLVLDGSARNDVLHGGAGNDLLRGGAGSDQLDGGAGRNRLAGGRGDDVVTGSAAGVDVLVIDSGRTESRLALSGEATRADPRGGASRIAAGTVSGPDGTDRFAGVDVIEFRDGRLVFDLADPAAQVVRLYQVALGRGTDPGGLASWSDKLAAGTPLTALAAEIAASPEYVARHAGTARDAVAQIYRDALAREPDAAGLEYWTDVLRARGPAELLANLAESAEALARGAATVAAGVWDPDAEAGSVARLYHAGLGRRPDAAGFDYWMDRLDAGAPLLEMAQAFSGSAEFQARHAGSGNAAFVRQVYRDVLGREADSVGLSRWTYELDVSLSRAELLLGFSESAEFQARTVADVGQGVVFA